MQDFTKPPQNLNNQYGLANSEALALSSEAIFFQKIYFWMCGGLVVTALVAMALARSVTWINFLRSQSMGFLLIFGAQIGLVLLIGLLKKSASDTVLKAIFLVYAASMGMTVSLVLLVYPAQVITKAFFSAAAVYGAMAVYGLVTKRSLQALGAFLFMGLVGLIVSSLVNIFVSSPLLDYVICWVGVLVFAGLTAYDHQKLRVIHAGGFSDYQDEGKAVILGSLELYLDFINLFLFLVRLFGRRD
jgi:FtsH-binding integral membrane protein